MTPKAKPEATKVVQPTPAPQPTPALTAPVAAAAPSKQQATLETLNTAWTKRGVDLGKMKVTQDGKFLNVVVGEAWPIIRIGVGGGIDLPQVKSYPKAFDAAVNGDTLLKKQAERAQKAATPAPAATKPGSATEPKTPTTPAQKKQQAHDQLEKQLENRA